MVDTKKNLPVASVSRRSIPVTGFDFLNGSYKRSANARLAALCAVGLVVILAMAVLLHGINHSLMAQTARTEANAAFTQELASSQELTALSSSEGFSEDDMKEHLKERTDKAIAALKSSPSFTQLFTDVKTVTPSGITLDSVTYGSPTASAAAPKEGAAPAAPSSVTITAKAGNYDGIKAWQTALSTIPYLQVQPVTWTNGEEGTVVLSATATIVTESDSPRYLELMERLDLNAETVEK